MVDLTAAAAALKESASAEKKEKERDAEDPEQAVPGEVPAGGPEGPEGPRGTATSTSGGAGGDAGDASTAAAGRKKLNNGMSIYLNAGQGTRLAPGGPEPRPRRATPT